jgi:hypothetical protein
LLVCSDFGLHPISHLRSLGLAGRPCAPLPLLRRDLLVFLHGNVHLQSTITPLPLSRQYTPGVYAPMPAPHPHRPTKPPRPYRTPPSGGFREREVQRSWWRSLPTLHYPRPRGARHSPSRQLHHAALLAHDAPTSICCRPCLPTIHISRHCTANPPGSAHHPHRGSRSDKDTVARADQWPRRGPAPRGV